MVYGKLSSNNKWHFVQWSIVTGFRQLWVIGYMCVHYYLATLIVYNQRSSCSCMVAGCLHCCLYKDLKSFPLTVSNTLSLCRQVVSHCLPVIKSETFSNTFYNKAHKSANKRGPIKLLQSDRYQENIECSYVHVQLYVLSTEITG